MTTTFRDRPWEARLKGMGDIAEHAFEKNWKGTWARTGFNRPALNTTKIPSLVMYQPDYLAQNVHGETMWVEVQGCGSDGLLKFKHKKIDALVKWQEFTGVEVFLWMWDSSEKQSCCWKLRDVIAQMNRHPDDKFPEGHVYTAVPVEHMGPWTKGNPC